jgi:hypothetical protein
MLITCGTHENNPVEKWTSCNGFAIECLNSLPIEVFSRSMRERVLRAWPPAAPEPSLNDTRTLAYRMSNLDAAVISLKMKMMERPTIYEVCRYRLIVVVLLIEIGVLSSGSRVACASYFRIESRSEGSS